MAIVRRQRIAIAFDASAVSAACAQRGLRGFRLRAFAREPLAPGALVPSAVEVNVVRPEEISSAMTRLHQRLGISNRRVLVVLPDGVGRLTHLVAYRDASPEFHRFRLAPSLPYPATEAMIDALRLGDGSAVVGAVRRIVIQSYEDLLVKAGWTPERMDLAPLVALDHLRRRTPREGVGIDLILGDQAYSIAAWSAGRLKAFRSRRRAREADEMDRLWSEVERTATLLGGADPRVRAVGAGASAFLAHASACGRSVTPAWDLRHESLDVGGVELSWIGAVLA